VRGPGTAQARQRSAAWVAASATLALVGFAANSILCRGALGRGTLDPTTFTLVRLGCGAVTLALVVGHRRGQRTTASGPRRSAGTFALFAYAACFSFSYVRIDAGVGALVLFAVTQATMIGWGLVRGERPGPLEWCGIALALTGIAGLAAPGAAAPDPVGLALMALAGGAWGVYSLLGRGAPDPLDSNAHAFAAALAPAALLLLLPGRLHWTGGGLLLAATSGALASGLGYSLWYAALPQLSRTRAAALQLAVPVIAAAAGVVLLGEPVTRRLALAGAVILGGVALAVLGRRAPAGR
jgi:drug/metabolite transporter (DMT)-like permease